MTNPTETLNWFVMERAVKSGRWDVTASFKTMIAASNYCIQLRRVATNPQWDCCFGTKAEVSKMDDAWHFSKILERLPA